MLLGAQEASTSVLCKGGAGSISAGRPYFLALTQRRDVKWEAEYAANARIAAVD